MISDKRRDAQAKSELTVGVRKMILELLQLAILPEESGTCEVTKTIRTDGYVDPDQIKSVREMVGGEFRKHAGFREKRDVLAALCSDGIELFVSVPNAFGAFECDIIRQSGSAALREFCTWFLEIYLPKKVGETGKLCGKTPLQIKSAMKTVFEVGQGANSEKVIREADAVAWWELRQQLKQRQNSNGPHEWNENWLVFDVGGGSTDAALMRIGNGKFHPFVRMIKHAGITVAGNDVDELITYAIARASLQKENLPIDHSMVTERLEDQHPRGQARAGNLGIIEKEKVKWAKKMTDVLNKLERTEAEKLSVAAGSVETESEGPAQDHKELSDWRQWLSLLANPADLALAPQAPQINLSGLAITTKGIDIGFEDFAGQYGRFLQAAVCAVCDDLFLSAGEMPVIDRVIVSGRGCQLPGVQAILKHHLRAMGVIKETTPVAPATSDNWSSTLENKSSALAMKLACVRGCAYAASRGGINGLGFFVSQDVILTIGERNQSLWPAGTRVLHGMVASSVVHVPQMPTTFIDFYQRRFPKSIDRFFGRGQAWNQRQIGRINATMHEPFEFLVQFDCGTWRLAVWYRKVGENGRFELISDDPRPSVANPENPVTRLKLNWADAEQLNDN
jgi:hypothetical protein